MEPPCTMLIEAGEVVTDRWRQIGDDEALPFGDIIVSLERLQRDADDLQQRPGGLGVLLPPGAELAPIVALLPRLQLVAISFPAFRDGRGFSLARELRERHGFTGEIRAVGHVLPDHYVFLMRCGVSTVQVEAAQDPVQWRTALQSVRTGYTADAESSEPLSPLRRHLRIAADNATAASKKPV